MIILVGPSASGKTEVAKILKKKYSMNKVITHTTRAIRIHELNDVDYHFVSKDEFIKLKNKDFFVETTIYNNNYYGTSKKEVGDNKVLIVELNGVHAFKELNDPHIITFFLNASEKTRYQRMINRGDSIDKINERIINDKNSFSIDKMNNIDFVIDSEKYDLDQLSDYIYKLYIEKINH